MGAEPPSQATYCHACGVRAVAGRATFCHVCGTRLVAQSVSAPVPLASAPPSSNPDAVVPATRATDAETAAHADRQPTFVAGSQPGRARAEASRSGGRSGSGMPGVPAAPGLDYVPARSGGGSGWGGVLKAIVLIIVGVIVILFLVGFSIGFVRGFKKGFKKGFDNTQAIVLELAPAAGHVTEPVLYWHS